MKVAAYVAGIGVLGPGLNGWSEAAAVLRGERAYVPAPTVLPAPALLPPAERRRSGRVVKLALAIAAEAAAHARKEPAQLASVFCSSGGDGENCHEICLALAASAREISPTRFSNSVHNAAAGYWSIATGAMRESSVLCAFDASFAAGLLEALVKVTIDAVPVLLIAYDVDYPEPMRAKRPIPDAFGAALLLSPRSEDGALARLELGFAQESPDALAPAELDALRASIPAARCLPLLQRLARRTAGGVVLEYLGDASAHVLVEPC